MKKHVCKYSIIRFQPYPETEEFANIGVVLYVTDSKRIFFKLLDSKYFARITHFFGPMCKSVFVEASQLIRNELMRITDLMANTQFEKVDLYAELIREREGIIFFSDSRVMFSHDPVVTVNTLFEHYVHRSFLREPGYEEQMKKQLRTLLDASELGERYKEGSVGDADIYNVKFPFVSQTNQQTIIKPIHFMHEKPSQLIDHGITWLGKIQQLDKLGFITPDKVLFAYSAPDKERRKLNDAFREIKKQIEHSGVLMIDVKNQDEIVEFAAH